MSHSGYAFDTTNDDKSENDRQDSAAEYGFYVECVLECRRHAVGLNEYQKHSIADDGEYGENHREAGEFQTFFDIAGGTSAKSFVVFEIVKLCEGGFGECS